MIDISPLEKAIAQLQESLNYADSDLAKYDARLARQFRSAAIQAFEYTYELSHKMLKRYLEATEPTPESIDAMSFQELIRTGAEKGLLLHSWDVLLPGPCGPWCQGGSWRQEKHGAGADDALCIESLSLSCVQV